MRRHGSFLPGVNREDATVTLSQCAPRERPSARRVPPPAPTGTPGAHADRAAIPACATDATGTRGDVRGRFISLLEHVRHAPIPPLAHAPPRRSFLGGADILPSPFEGIEVGRPRWYGHSPLSA